MRAVEKRINSSKKQSNLAKLDQEARRQVLSILDRAGVNTGVERAQYETDRAPLATWMQQQADDGLDVFVHPWLLNERNEGNWRRDIPLEAAIGIKNTLASIAKHAGRSKVLFETGESFEVATNRLLAEIAKNAPVSVSV
jgi:hypothetical protein